MPKDEGIGGGGGLKPGGKVPASSSKSSSLALSDDRIDPMIDPQSTDPMDFPMALFDPVTVNTHEKERKQRQTVNTLNDIYKQVSRFDDIFIEPPFEVEPKAKNALAAEPDLSYENIKIMLSLYDWFAAAVFDVEACQNAMSDEDMLNSSVAMGEAKTYMRDRLRKLQTIKNEIQEKCYVMRTFLRKKTEVADEMFKEMGLSNLVHRPPPPKLGAGRGKAAVAAAAATDAAAAATPEAAPPPVVMSWRQAAKSVAEDLKKAKADGFFEFIETEDKFKIVMATVEKQEAKIKELVSNQKALQASIHSLSASGHNIPGDAPHTGRRESSKTAGLKALSEFNDRILKLLKQAAESIKLGNGSVTSLNKAEPDDEELLKNIDAELSYARKMMESASMKSLGDVSSKHSSLDENRSTEKMKVGGTDAGGGKMKDTNAPSTTTATVAPIPEEAKKEKKAKKTNPKNKEKKKEVAKKK